MVANSKSKKSKEGTLHTPHCAFSNTSTLAIGMGKRKLHSVTYFQCDWTGLPMRATNCYMPTWNDAGKLVKQGSYCNWESVVAHALETQQGIVTKIREHIDDLVGVHVNPAPHYSCLAWFHRDEQRTEVYQTPLEFQQACVQLSGPVVAIRIMSDGSAHEVVCTEQEVSDRFGAHLTRPYTIHGPAHTPQTFKTMRRKAMKDRDLSVFYWPYRNGLPFNQTASNLFKMQIWGDAVVAQQTREPCCFNRERYVNYFFDNFVQQFTAANQKKRKEMGSTGISTDAYESLKREMQEDLSQVEAAASASACPPSELAKASVLPPPSGKELARLRPPPISRAAEPVGVE